MHGPSTASGGTTTFTREPSGRRASATGERAVGPQAERPDDPLDRAARPRRARGAGRWRSSRPARSTHTGPAPLTITSVTAASASSGSSGPEAGGPGRDRARRPRATSPSGSSGCSRRTSARDRGRRSAARAGSSSSRRAWTALDEVVAVRAQAARPSSRARRGAGGWRAGRRRPPGRPAGRPRPRRRPGRRRSPRRRRG